MSQPAETTAAILRDAAALVRRGLAKGVFAKDNQGEPRSAYSAFAAQWCVIGAIQRAAHARSASPAPAIRAVACMIGAPTLASMFAWNDAPERTGEDVAKALERAADLVARKGD